MSRTQVNQPNVVGVLVGSFSTVDNTAQKVLLIGQRTSVGSAAANTLVQNVQNNNTTVNSLFGPRSMIANAIRGFRKINTDTQLDVIVLDDDGSGVPNTHTITITGTATADGTLTVVVGSEIDHTFSVAVTNGDTPTVIALAISTAITADTQVPVTSAASVGVVTLTAANDGTVGNALGVSISGVVASVTHAVVNSDIGATDPSFTTGLALVSDIRYQNIIWPYSEDLTTIQNFLAPRFNSNGPLLDGRAVTSITDTFSGLETTGNGENDQNLKIIGDFAVSETSFNAPGMFEIPYVKAAYDAGITSRRLTDGVSIADLVIANLGALDRVGGNAIASLPLFNTPLDFMPLIDIDHGFSGDEIADLTAAGISIWGNNSENNEAIMDQQVTTYKTDASTNSDDTFKFQNYDDTGRVCREFYFNNYRARFNQTRLTAGSVVPGRAMANADTVRRFSKRLYKELADDALVVSGIIESTGQNALEFYDDNLTVVATNATTIQVTMILPIVTQLRNIFFTIEQSIDVFAST